MNLFAEGIAIGFSIAAPVGAINFLCIEETLQRGISFGIASGLGVATGEMLYGVLVALFLKTAQSALLAYETPLICSGGLFLSYIGISKFFSTTSFHQERVIKGGLLSAYAVTFFLTIINPATILEVMALFTGLSIDKVHHHEAVLFVMGTFLGAIIWWFVLAFMVGTFRKKISTEILQYMNYVTGGIIFIFGLYALSKLWD